MRRSCWASRQTGLQYRHSRGLGDVAARAEQDRWDDMDQAVSASFEDADFGYSAAAAGAY
jgi:hypothetical protein